MCGIVGNYSARDVWKITSALRSVESRGVSGCQAWSAAATAAGQNSHRALYLSYIFTIYTYRLFYVSPSFFRTRNILIIYFIMLYFILLYFIIRTHCVIITVRFVYIVECDSIAISQR